VYAKEYPGEEVVVVVVVVIVVVVGVGDYSNDMHSGVADETSSTTI